MIGRSPVVYPLKPKLKKPRLRRALFRLALIVLLPALFFSAAYLANLPSLRVADIEVRGLGAVSAVRAEDVVLETQAAISGRRWFFLPRDNFLLISSASVESDIRQKFSQLSDVSVDKKLPRRLVVEVKERVLWGIYCRPARLGQDEAAADARRCFYLDERGVAYEDISGYEGTLLPLITGDQAVAVGDKAVSGETLEFFGKAKESLAAVGARLFSLGLATATPSDARLGLAERWYIIADLNQPVNEWLEVLKTLLAKEIGERRSELEYIDLRFGRKVFYKFRN